MKLSDTKIRTAKPSQREQKMADGHGLFLVVTPTGSKLWRLRYWFNGKEKKLSLGRYPVVTLKETRRKRDEALKLLDEGVDPSRARKEAKLAASLAAADTFDGIAEEYLHKMKQEGRASATMSKARWLFGQLSPEIGDRPISEITPHELLMVLKKVEQTGKRETARRLRSFASRVFRYAVATARASHDPAQLLRGALIAPVPKHLAAITDAGEFGALLRAIEGYSGQPVTFCALRLTPHLFQRPGEVRKMLWDEIDFDKAVWTISAGKMKKRLAHHVPLSRQSISILLEVRDLTGNGNYVFPSIRTASRPMSENTVNGALRRLGYGGDEMTAHGFRSTASSLLNESGKWNPDAIERALSHADSNQVRGIYNRSAYWSERVEMAQWWSDYITGLRDGAEIVPIDRAKTQG
jgi:integrase